MIGEQREKFDVETSQPSVEDNENLTKLAEAKLQNVKDGNVGEHQFEQDLRQQQLYKKLISSLRNLKVKKICLVEKTLSCNIQLVKFLYLKARNENVRLELELLKARHVR